MTAGRSRRRRTSSSVWRTDRLARDDRLHELPLGSRVMPRESAGVAFRDVAGGERLLDGRFELEEPERVGHSGPRPADARCNLVLGQAELVGELPVRMRFFHRVQVRPLDVLDDGHGQLISLSHLADDRRDSI